MIEYLLMRYGWTYEYAMKQPLRRLFVLYGYALDDREKEPNMIMLKAMAGM